VSTRGVSASPAVASVVSVKYGVYGFPVFYGESCLLATGTRPHKTPSV
jgi:hypothetical protein